MLLLPLFTLQNKLLLHQYSLSLIIVNLSKSAENLIEIQNCLTFIFNKTVLQYRDIIIKITLFILSLLISISWSILFLKFKHKMLFDKANNQFLINNNSCEVKVH
jgi:hypothetical protein